VTVFGIGLTTAAGGLTVAGSIVNLLGSVALRALTAPKLPEPLKPDNIKINTKTAAAARIGHFGVVKVGGNNVFHRAKDGVSYRVVVHGHGEIDRVLQTYLNEEPVTLAEKNFIYIEELSERQAALALIFPHMPINAAEVEYLIGDVLEESYFHTRPRVNVQSRLGVAPAQVYAELSPVWPSWTSAHRLDGLWTSMIKTESLPAANHRGMYPNGEPMVTILAETTRCYDPRDDQERFTENAALIINQYLSSPDGFNRAGILDAQDLLDAADLADLNVPLAAGGSDKLWRLGGSFALNERPHTVLARMLDACAGTVRLRPSGKVGLNLGGWTAPEFSLTYGDILSLESVEYGPDALDRYNELPVRCNDHSLGHVEVDAEAWIDTDLREKHGEILVGGALEVMMAPSQRQARHVAQIKMARDNPDWQIKLFCKPKALPAIYEDAVILAIPELGFEGVAEVKRYTLQFDKGLLKGVALELHSIDPAAFVQKIEDQGTVQLLPESETSSGIPLPMGLVASAAGAQAGIGVGWQAPVSDALSPVLRYRVAPSGGWQEVPVASDVTQAVISGLSDGVAYDVSLAFKTGGEVVGAFVVVAGVTAAAVTDPPLAPTALSVGDEGGGVALVSFVASASAGLWKTELYRDGVKTGEIFSAPSAAISVIDACGAGTYNWTARSLNVSAIPSDADAGPVGQTIT
jgi:hypothetical protein